MDRSKAPEPLNGIRGGEDCIIEENPKGISLLDRLCAFRGGRFSPTLIELPLENGDGDGGSTECELASRSSIEISAETASEIEVDDESR